MIQFCLSFIFCTFLILLPSVSPVNGAAAPRPLSDAFLRNVVTSLDLDAMWSDINTLAVERQPDTEAHRRVQRHIVDSFSPAQWTVSGHIFIIVIVAQVLATFIT